MITLKSIKHSPSLSEETYAFTATVYFDNQKVGFVRNDGRGGCNLVHFDSRELEKEVSDYVEALPDEIFEGTSMRPQLDFLITDEVTKYLEKKDQARQTKAQDRLDKKNAKREADFVASHLTQNQSRGLQTLKLKTTGGISCVGVKPNTPVNDAFLADIQKKLKHGTITGWEIVN